MASILRNMVSLLNCGFQGTKDKEKNMETNLGVGFRVKVLGFLNLTP